VLDVRSGRIVGEPIPRVHEGLVHWAPDSRSLTFNQLQVLKPGDAESETFLDSRVLWLRVGDRETKARAVFGPTVDRSLGLVRLDVGEVLFSLGSPWMIARTTDTTLPEGNLFLAKVSELGKTRIPWRRISRFEDKITRIELKGNDLYVLTHAEAPRHRVLKLDLRQPDLRSAREVARAPEGGVLEDFALTRDALIGSVREGAFIGLRRYGDGDRQGVAIPLPFKGAAAVHGDPAHHATDVLYTLGGWTSMPRTFVFGMASPTPRFCWCTG